MGYLQLSRTILASHLSGFFRPVAPPIAGAAGIPSLPPSERMADDFAKVPVTGKLVAADANEIIIHRSEAEADDVNIHFPVAGSR